MKERRKYSKEEFEQIIKGSISIADVCRKCGWKPQGDNYKVIKRYIKEYNISTEHFTGKMKNLLNIILKKIHTLIAVH